MPIIVYPGYCDINKISKALTLYCAITVVGVRINDCMCPNGTVQTQSHNSNCKSQTQY